MASEKSEGQDRIGQKETNNFKQGRTGSETKTINGPAVGSVRNPNPTKGGGINRATQGTTQH